MQRLGQFIKPYKEKVDLIDDKLFTRITIKLYGQGVVKRDESLGKDIKTRDQFYVKAGQFIYSNIDARNGAFGIVPNELDRAIITNSFTVFDCDDSLLLPEYLVLLLSTQYYMSMLEKISVGTTNRRNVKPDALSNISIPVPPIEKQKEIVAKFKASIEKGQGLKTRAEILDVQSEKNLFEMLGISRKQNNSASLHLNLINYKQIYEWGADKNQNSIEMFYDFKQAKMLKELSGCIIDAFRGKSPVYSNKSNSIILNQKCNRWNYIDINYARAVDDHWLASINDRYRLREGDIIINSTGEGTLGRASLVGLSHAGLCVDSHMLVLRLNSKKINPKFVLKQINSSFGQKQVELLKGAQATKQTELGIDNLLKMKFVVPINSQGYMDIDLQNKIINIYDQCLFEKEELLRRANEQIDLAKQGFESEIFD